MIIEAGFMRARNSDGGDWAIEEKVKDADGTEYWKVFGIFRTDSLSEARKCVAYFLDGLAEKMEKE